MTKKPILTVVEKEIERRTRRAKTFQRKLDQMNKAHEETIKQIEAEASENRQILNALTKGLKK